LLASLVGGDVGRVRLRGRRRRGRGGCRRCRPRGARLGLGRLLDGATGGRRGGRGRVRRRRQPGRLATGARPGKEVFGDFRHAGTLEPVIGTDLRRARLLRYKTAQRSATSRLHRRASPYGRVVHTGPGSGAVGVGAPATSRLHRRASPYGRVVHTGPGSGAVGVGAPATSRLHRRASPYG